MSRLPKSVRRVDLKVPLRHRTGSPRRAPRRRAVSGRWVTSGGVGPCALVFKPTIKSSHFTAHRRACGVEGSGRFDKVYHSFRNNVTRCLSQAGVSEDRIQQVIGHRRKSFTLSTYDTGGLTMREKQAVVEKISYPGLVTSATPG